MLEWFHDDFMSDGGSGGYSSEFNSEQEFESFDDYLEWPHNHSSHESVSLAAEYLRAPLSNPDFTCADHQHGKRTRRESGGKILLPPMFTEEALRCFCDSPSVVEDGKREFTAGAVSPFVFDGNGTFRATVAPRMMQDRGKFTVTVSYTQDHIIGAKCTCQTGHMFRFAYCAHVAAVLMSLVKSRDTALSTETIKDIVKKLPKEVLENAMIQMLQEGRGFNALRMELKNQKITAEALQPPSVLPLLMPSENELRERVAAAMHSSHAAGDYIPSYERFPDIVCIMANLKTMLDDERIVAAIRVGEVITDEVLRFLQSHAHSHANSATIQELKSFWLQAMLSFAMPSKEMRRSWAEKLEAWDTSTHTTYFHPAVIAAQHGWDLPEIERALKGQQFEQGSLIEPVSVLDMRVQLLRVAKRLEEALRIIAVSAMKLSGYALREFISDLIVNHYLDDAICPSLTSGLDPEEKYFLARHVAMLRPFEAFRLAQSGMGEFEAPRWLPVKEPMCLWLLNHAIECDLFLNRSRVRPSLPIIEPGRSSTHSLVSIKSLPVDSSVSSLYSLCVRKLGKLRVAGHMTAEEAHALYDDLPLPVRASLLVEEACVAALQGSGHSNEHVLRCSTLLQMKGYTRNAIDLLARGLKGGNLISHALKQAIASKQQDLLDDVISGLLKSLEGMYLDGRRFLLPVLEELSLTRPVDALRVAIRAVSAAPFHEIPDIINRIASSVPTSDLVSLTSSVPPDFVTSATITAFFEIANLLAERKRSLEAALLTLRCLHAPQTASDSQERTDAMSNFFIKHATHAAREKGSNPRQVFDRLMAAWEKHASATGFRKMRELAKKFDLWDVERQRFVKLLPTVSADVVEKLDLLLDDGNWKEAVALWRAALDRASLGRWAERLASAKPSLASTAIEHITTHVWDSLWMARYGSASPHDIQRALRALVRALKESRPDVDAAIEACETLAQIGGMLYTMSASRPTYMRLVTHLQNVRVYYMRAARLASFDKILRWITTNHSGKKTLLVMAEYHLLPTEPLPPPRASATESKKRRRDK